MTSTLFRLLLTAILLISSQARAGIVTGAIIGYALGGKTVNIQPQILLSDKHDVIACPTFTLNSNTCYDKNLESISPEQYAGNCGYKYIYRKGVIITDSKWIVMEVGN